MKNINAIAAAKVAALVVAGSTSVDALRIVCGPELVDTMISNLYDTLRAPAPKSTGASSRKYGACEVCGKDASEVFIVRVDNDCAFGHKDCLEGSQK